MSFSKYFKKKNNAMPYSTSKVRKTLQVLLLVMILVIIGAGEVKTSQSTSMEWKEHVRQLWAEGKGLKIMRSKIMKSEKSPEEFLKKYKKIREQVGDKFTFQTFVEDVARGLVIEQKYDPYEGVLYILKKNLNPNYRVGRVMAFNCDKFCITPELLRNTFGKEDKIVTYRGDNKTESYRYFFLGANFEVDFMPGINKKCASQAVFDSGFFYKMENRDWRTGKTIDLLPEVIPKDYL
jgi:hypothetical protein